jgi:hypothetical protein
MTASLDTIIIGILFEDEAQVSLFCYENTTTPKVQLLLFHHFPYSYIFQFSEIF